MLATNFDTIEKGKLDGLFQYILKNDFSNFYKEKFNDFNTTNLTDYANFSSLPFLFKNDILSAPLKDRTFVDENSIKTYTISSGTSKNPIPSIMPHTVKKYKEIGANKYDQIKKS